MSPEQVLWSPNLGLESARDPFPSSPSLLDYPVSLKYQLFQASSPQCQGPVVSLSLCPFKKKSLAGQRRAPETHNLNSSDPAAETTCEQSCAQEKGDLVNKASRQ